MAASSGNQSDDRGFSGPSKTRTIDVQESFKEVSCMDAQAGRVRSTLMKRFYGR